MRNQHLFDFIKTNVWFALPKANLVTLRIRHLFEIIKTNRKIQIFQNEKSILTIHRAGPFPWRQPNWSKLPVSTPWSVLEHILTHIFINVYSDYDLNAICHESCIEETYKCIMACEPTDSTCIYTCLRAEDSCRASKNFHLNIIKHLGLNDPVFISSNFKSNWGCPCDIECPNGCDGCENSICECSVSLQSIFPVQNSGSITS